MNFNQVNVTYSFNDLKQAFTLTLDGSDRVFNLKIKDQKKGGTQADYEQWKSSLITTIERSNGRKKNLSLNSYKEF